MLDGLDAQRGGDVGLAGAGTAELKKGKYIYYHCTVFRGKCPERFVREEVLEEKFASLLSPTSSIVGWQRNGETSLIPVSWI